MYHVQNKNFCLVYSLPPYNARVHPHLCGPDAKGFRPVVLNIRPPPPKKEEVYQPDREPTNDY